jgi:hypothetical protein
MAACATRNNRFVSRNSAPPPISNRRSVCIIASSVASQSAPARCAARQAGRQTSRANGSPPSATAPVSRFSQRVAESSSGGGGVAGSGAPSGGMSAVVVTATPTPNGTLPSVTCPSSAERTFQTAV